MYKAKRISVIGPWGCLHKGHEFLSLGSWLMSYIYELKQPGVVNLKITWWQRTELVMRLLQVTFCGLIEGLALHWWPSGGIQKG